MYIFEFGVYAMIRIIDYLIKNIYFRYCKNFDRIYR
jgi:hypothetical protein